MAGGITEFLLKHTGLCPVSFHMPGHKGSELYRRLGYGDFLEMCIRDRALPENSSLSADRLSFN